eukprot:3061552-Prymnesium_polylepis.1
MLDACRSLAAARRGCCCSRGARRGWAHAVTSGNCETKFVQMGTILPTWVRRCWASGTEGIFLVRWRGSALVGHSCKMPSPRWSSCMNGSFNR